MGKPLEVWILGHKAVIERISGQTALPPFNQGDKIIVWVDFGDNPLGSMQAAPILLPVEAYDKASLLVAVALNGEDQLRESVKRHEQESAETWARKNRKDALDLVIRGIKIAVGLEK